MVNTQSPGRVLKHPRFCVHLSHLIGATSRALRRAWLGPYLSAISAGNGRRRNWCGKAMRYVLKWRLYRGKMLYSKSIAGDFVSFCSWLLWRSHGNGRPPPIGRRRGQSPSRVYSITMHRRVAIVWSVFTVKVPLRTSTAGLQTVALRVIQSAMAMAKRNSQG